MLPRRIGLLARRLSVSAAFAFLVTAVFPSPAACAQSSAVDRTIGDAVVVLGGAWKFHPGDDMAWASPGFDDAGWGSQDLTPPEGSYDPMTGSSGFVPGWTTQGYPRLTGYAWYRLRIRLRRTDTGAAAADPLTLTMPINFDDA